MPENSALPTLLLSFVWRLAAEESGQLHVNLLAPGNQRLREGNPFIYLHSLSSDRLTTIGPPSPLLESRKIDAHNGCFRGCFFG